MEKLKYKVFEIVDLYHVYFDTNITLKQLPILEYNRMLRY